MYIQVLGGSIEVCENLFFIYAYFLFAVVVTDANKPSQLASCSSLAPVGIVLSRAQLLKGLSNWALYYALHSVICFFTSD